MVFTMLESGKMVKSMGKENLQDLMEATIRESMSLIKKMDLESSMLKIIQ